MSRADQATQTEVSAAMRLLRATRLTPNFSYYELAQPDRHGFAESLYPPAWLMERGLPVLWLAEKIRAKCGNKPMQILSAYRSPAYNKAVGGEDQSQHMQGRALDIRVVGMASTLVHENILEMFSQGLIPELGGLGLYEESNFCHIDVRRGKLARWKGK